MTYKTKKYLLVILLPLMIIIADQWSKLSIIHHLNYLERIPVINNFFDLTHVYNPGAAFSFLADAGDWKHYFFIILAFMICCYLIYLVWKEKVEGIAIYACLFIIGGAIGNVIDRLLHGHVIDFLLFYINNHYYPAFNIADSFICIGAFFLIIDGFFSRNKR